MTRPRRPSLLGAALAAALLLGGFVARLLPRVEPAPALDDPGLLPRLQALGYLDWAPLEEGELAFGVRQYDRKRAQPGLNLYASRSDRQAFLMDMSGRVLHTWSAEGPNDRWTHIELAPGGDLLVLSRGAALERLDWNSRLLWRLELPAHHDVALDAAGQIYTLSRQAREIPYRDGRIPIIDQAIAVVSGDGQLLRQVWLHPLFAQLLSTRRLERIRDHSRTLRHWFRRLRGRIEIPQGHSDVYHVNSLELLDRDVPGLGSRGQALVSIRSLDLVAVVDLESPRVVWSWGPGELDRQHQPSLLENGNLLIFDNGWYRGWSRVIEVEPATGRVVWEYSGDPPRSLFTIRMGGCQKLPNGNVLITESHRGRALEVAPDGSTVWEFLNPDLDEDRKSRRTLYRMTRLDREAVARLRAAGHAAGAS